MKAKLDALLAEYGKIVLLVYLSTSVVTFGGAMIAIKSGFQVEGAAEGAGLVAASWVFLKLTQPIRIAVTIVLTPIVAKIVRRKKPTEA